MPYQPYYKVTDWQNLPSQKTALNRTNLLHAETGIKEADNRIVQLDAKKAELAIVNAMVKDVNLDAKTGVLTVTLLNGTTKAFDLDIERVVTNFDITDNNELVLTLADGTQKVIDLTRFVYSVASTDTVIMEIKDRIIHSTIVDGSVTMEKLDAAIQSEFRQYMLDAQSARDSALQYQKYAKRYALGDAEFEGSEINNAKYYYEQSKSQSESAAQSAQSANVDAETAGTQAGIAIQKATNAAASANNAAADAQIAIEKAQIATQNATTAVEKAKEAADSEKSAAEKSIEASDSAKISKRYAVGGVIAEDTNDNAKWYYEQSRTLKEEIDVTADLVIPRFHIDFETGELKSDKAAQGMRFWIEDGVFCGETEVI